MSQIPKKQYKDVAGELTISDIYPALTPEQQADAEYRLLQYLGIVKRIFERISLENPKLLTEIERRATLRIRKNRR